MKNQNDTTGQTAGVTGAGYTVAQVLANLREFENQLRKYPRTLDCGPGWVMNQARAIAARGIEPDATLKRERNELLDQLQASLQFTLTKTRKPGDWCFNWIVEPLEPCPCIICSARALIARIESGVAK